MASTLKDTYNLIFSNKNESRKYQIRFTQDEIAVKQNVIEFNEYALYSVLADSTLNDKHFMLYMENDDEKSEYNQIIDSAIDINRNSESNMKEYFPQYQNGFLFYRIESNSRKRMVLEVDGNRYISAIISVRKNNISKEADNTKEILDMLLFIYDEQPLLLLSVFQKSPLSVYIDKDSRIVDSVDTRLALMEKGLKIYQRQFNAIVRSLKYKLSAKQYIDRIDKLNGINSDTLTFMARNPQYLVENKKKKGIRYNGKIYMPEKTLVAKNVLDYGIYENCYILSFLKMLMYECERLKLRIKLAMEDSVNNQNRARIKSQKDDFGSLVQKYHNQLQKVQKHEKNAKRLFVMYQTAFKIEDMGNITAKINRPRATAIFRQIFEYRVFYKEVFVPWFEYGIVIDEDLTLNRDDAFVTAVSNPCTTYELYIVCKWMRYLMEEGYEFESKKAKYAGIHEKESRYSDNAYEFVFSKCSDDTADDIEYITIFYSPSVYIPFVTRDGRFVPGKGNVDNMLYRNTWNSFVCEEKETSGRGNHYEPDFILKYQKGNVIRYIMADAKHKDFEAVRKEDMPRLLYKYIDSIRVMKRRGVDARVAGLCAVYNKHSYNYGDLLDTTDYFEFVQCPEEEPFAKMLYMNITDSDCDWENIFTKMLSFIKQFKNRDFVDKIN